MKIFDKNFVGIDHTREDITVAPLAFLTPYEDNAAGKKRRDSVRQWLNGYYWVPEQNKVEKNTETRIVDNKPKTGFKVVAFADRYSTSNKLARIFDPDGFELEISIANLIDLMLFTTIEYGEIKSELIWARDGANNWLLPTDTDMFRRALREGQTLEAEIGDRVIGNHGNEYVYLGRGHIQNIFPAGTERFVPVDELDNANFWDERAGGKWKLESDRVVTHPATGKSSHVYALVKKSSGGVTKIHLETRQKPMKITAILGTSDIVVDENTVCYGSGTYCTADGDMAGGRMIGDGIDDPHRWYTRYVMFREQPFTSDDIDQDLVLPQIEAGH